MAATVDLMRFDSAAGFRNCGFEVLVVLPAPIFIAVGIDKDGPRRILANKLRRRLLK